MIRPLKSIRTKLRAGFGHAPSTRLALISDVHSNLPALEAVLEDIRKQNVTRILCLGDIVGYGAQPRECLERLRHLDALMIRGNHDHFSANLEDVDRWNSAARAGIMYSRAALTTEEKEYLADLPYVLQGPDFTVVHSSVHEPDEWHYLLTATAFCISLKGLTVPVGFYGHTHCPLVAEMSRGLVLQGPMPKKILRQNGRYLVNVGAVGQPRDGDPRACYVLYTPAEKKVEFRRVRYDIAAAQRLIRKAGLPEMSARRLERGQ